MTADWREGLWRARAEQALSRPPMIPATGSLRAELLALRAEAKRALADADARLRAAALDRVAAAERIRRAGRALAGTGQRVDAETGEVVQYLRRMSVASPDPLPDAADLDVVAGEDLRDLVVGILQVVGEPLGVADLVRVLAAHGFTPPGRPSQTVSNALGVEVRRGAVERVARGRYRSIT
jgi:hypothetical protein